MNTLFRIGNNWHVINNLIKFIDELDKSKIWIVEIREEKKNKTRMQERYFHKLVDIICKFNGDEKFDMKRDITGACGLWDEFTVKEDMFDDETGELEFTKGEVLRFPRATAGLKVKEYSIIIEAAQMICEKLELSYPEPSHYGMEI